MSAKKKVQFNDNEKTYKKYNKDEDQSDEDEYSGDEDAEKIKKHSLDSDEEDNTDKYKLLKRETLDDIGQEDKTAEEFNDGIKLTPFNMKDELDEGDFDKEGYFHWKKDKNEIKDAWLDNIDWANINSFKKTGQKSTDLSQNVDEKVNKESDEESDDEDDDSQVEETNHSLDDESLKFEKFKEILSYLKPGETVLKAIKRLGSSKSAGSSGASLSASQRWLKKKNQPQASSNSKESEASKADSESLEKLTGIANYFIDRGFYDIYEETYDKLKKKVEDSEKAVIANDKESFDMFADEVNEESLKAAEKKSAVLEDTVIQWVYKLENTDDSKLHGPFTSQKMLEMSLKGEFKENGVWCRKLNDSSANDLFYNSKRIDFDLYS